MFQYFHYSNYARDNSPFDTPYYFMIQSDGQKIYKGIHESHDLHLKVLIVKTNNSNDENINELIKKESYIFKLGINKEEDNNKNPNLVVKMI